MNSIHNNIKRISNNTSPQVLGSNHNPHSHLEQNRFSKNFPLSQTHQGGMGALGLTQRAGSLLNRPQLSNAKVNGSLSQKSLLIVSNQQFLKPLNACSTEKTSQSMLP
jgi:hypothetical protein